MRTCAKASSFIVLTFVFFLRLLTPQLCRADNISSGPLNFQTSNQSMWSSGVTNAVNFQLFNANLPININNTLGSITTTTVCFPAFLGGGCVDTGSFGAQVSVNMNADLRATSNLTLTGGSVNATLPVNVTLGFPGAVANNTPFNITASGFFQPGASLTTQSPGVNLSMDLFGSSQGGSIQAEACVVGCVGPATVNIPTTNGTVTTNVFNTNIISDLVGKTVDLTPPSGDVVAQFGIPYVNTSAQTSLPVDATTPLTLQSQAVGSTPFVSVNADLTNIAATLLGLPPLNNSFNVGTTTISYNLLQFLAGIGLNATQAFSLAATPEVAYRLTTIGPNPVTTIFNPEPLGTPQSFIIPTGATGVDVTPFYSMVADLTNQTGVVPAFELQLNALKFNVGGLQLPYLLNENFPFPINSLNLNLFDQNFPLLGFNTIQGTAFEITATNPTAPVPEPPTLLLLGAGFLLMGGLLRRRYQAKVLGHQV